MADPPFRVLFVCWGNICRSPAGENVFRHQAAAAGLAGRVACDSAGTIGCHAGKSPDARMAETLRRRGVPVSGQARGFSARDFSDFDLILTMDGDNLADVLALARDEEHRVKVRPFTDFCRKFDHAEVPDPYYGGDAGFELVADLIEDGVAGLLDHIRSGMS
ncbi:MAG: low molecular weight phosphotyrosine protein phosphatase [Akkermansiaceae bacterium]|nr:low molecular weight phosphotyrosine protein phosphatase [Akkermansiaceae bacterium]NNM29926.1 low molecular weight phosphotyrosine protein phosphatase [Akkermansiaceae bacterium]